MLTQILVLLFLIASSHGEEKVEAVEITPDGTTTTVETESIDTNANNEAVDTTSNTTIDDVSSETTTSTTDSCTANDYECQLNDLRNIINQLGSKIEQQESTISQLDSTLREYIAYGKDSGFLQNMNEIDYFGLLSSQTYTKYPFVMLEVMAVRLPSRDALPVPRNKQHGAMVKRRKTRFLHIIITLTRDGVFNIWDEHQNNLYEYHDPTLQETDNSVEYTVVSAIQNNPTREGTWMLVSRRGESWIRVYSVATWRRRPNDDSGTGLPVDDSQYLSAKLSLQHVIWPPPQPAPKKKVKVTTDEEGNETTEELDEVEEIKNATVTGVAAYQHSKRKAVIASYSDGKIFAYRTDGTKSGQFKSPNESVTVLSQTSKKMEVVAGTDDGFFFMKLPKLAKLGKFCSYPAGFETIQSIHIDSVYPFVMFITSTNGKMAIYNIKRVTKKTCEPVDVFEIHPDSPLELTSTKGHLLMTSTEGLHIYNTSFSPKYEKPFLSLMRRFDEDFDNFIGKESKPPVLISSWSDVNGKTVIAYAESASRGNIKEGDSWRMVVLDSNLPVFDEKESGGGMGWTAILSRAPLLIGVGAFVLFFGYFKKQGKSGAQFAGRSPLGKLTSALTGRGPRMGGGGRFGGGGRGRGQIPTHTSMMSGDPRMQQHVQSGGGGRQIRADQIMDRWRSRHPNIVTPHNSRGYPSDSD